MRSTLSYLSDVVSLDGTCVKSEFSFTALHVELVDDADARSLRRCSGWSSSETRDGGVVVFAVLCRLEILQGVHWL